MDPAPIFVKVRCLWLAEAGATKTHWGCALEGEGPSLWRWVRRAGLNAEAEGWPQAEETLRTTVRFLLTEAGWPPPTELYYYGPALHRPEAQQRMQRLLAEVGALPLQRVFVFHDLLGAARGAYPEGQGIVAILGTGSNCAFWDGEAIRWQAGGHGYLLGDEGSGADLGRQLISALLHDEVPRYVVRRLEAQGLYTSLHDLRSAVYRAPRPSAFLAGFVPALAALADHPWVRALVRSRFEAFIRRTWARWPAPRPVKYVGGVAEAFEPLLRAVTEEYGGLFQGVVPGRQLAERLLAYHLSSKQS